MLSDFCGSIAETIAKNVGVSASSLAGTARHPTLFAFTQQLLGGPIEGSTLTQVWPAFKHTPLWYFILFKSENTIFEMFSKTIALMMSSSQIFLVNNKQYVLY